MPHFSVISVNNYNRPFTAMRKGHAITLAFNGRSDLADKGSRPAFVLRLSSSIRRFVAGKLLSVCLREGRTVAALLKHGMDVKLAIA
jgi:hypothetical protein